MQEFTKEKMYKNRKKTALIYSLLMSGVKVVNNTKRNAQWLIFKRPIIEGDMELSLENENHVETVVLMSRGE